MSTSQQTEVARKLRIGPGSAGISMDPEEFDALRPGQFNDRFRYELIRGVLVVSPPAGSGERSPNDELGYLLRTYQDTHPQGSSLDGTLYEQTVPIGDDRRRADRALWIGLGRIPDDETDLPTILVEFVSARRRDRLRDYEEKRDEYLGAGVKEYWVIDRFRRMMTVYRNTPAGPAASTVAASATYQTELLPGFVLPVARLLTSADQWARKGRERRPPARGAP